MLDIGDNLVWHYWGMGRFDFDKYIREASFEDVDLGCIEDHKHEVLVVNAYDVDLYQSWTLELKALLQKNPEVTTLTVNIGLPFLQQQRSIFRQFVLVALKLLGKLGFTLESRHQVSYDLNFRTRQFMLATIKSLFSSFRYVKHNSFSKVSSLLDFKSRSLFSTFATDLGTIEFEVRDHIMKLFLLDLSYEHAFRKTNEILSKRNPCVLFVGNGRLVRAAAVVSAARSSGTPVIIVERGAYPGTYDFYKSSPHSIRERRMQALKLYSQFGKTEAEEISNAYIQLRRDFDPISGLQWGKNFQSGKLPPLTGRKICVCFTSTEIEFAVFGDKISGDEFRNQEEAFRSLAKHLDPNEWEIVIRRHPYGTKPVKKDPELKLWSKLSEYQHVSFVGPDENIDSYELVRRAHLVAHFNSSMGPEAIGMRSAPVISMGPTLWEENDSPYNVTSEKKLIHFIDENYGVRDQSDILLWGLYWGTFGYKFQIVEWNNNKGYINGRRIL